MAGSSSVKPFPELTWEDKKEHIDQALQVVVTPQDLESLNQGDVASEADELRHAWLDVSYMLCFALSLF